jgi:hypothetical protein
MNTIAVNNWRPASIAHKQTPFQPALRMGQQGAADAFFNDPTLAVATDVVATAASGYLAYGMAKVDGPWTTFWLVVSVAMGVKTLHDFSRMKT